jgi:hypothetical protein
MPPLNSPSIASPRSSQFAAPQAQRLIQTGRNSPVLGSPQSRSGAPSPSPRRSRGPKDFSYLLRPEIFHPLSSLTIPAPFRNSAKQPAPGTPIPELLARGHYRAAAIAATNALTGIGTPAPSPSDHARIFDLLYTRLACLTLLENGTALAAQEVKALEDLNSAFYLDEATAQHLVPWPLRVLNVRLQALGFGDPRRAVMSYYELARDARAQLAAATVRRDNSARELWKDRLADLGLRIAGVLIEMDDLGGAADHLASMHSRGDGKIEMSRALLWLQIGDTSAARECVPKGEAGARVVDALCDMADGEYGSALETWKELIEEYDDDEMIGVNTAVCLLYVGKMQEVSRVASIFQQAAFD